MALRSGFILLVFLYAAKTKSEDITAQYCTQTLNGVMSGARCFFPGQNKTGWNDAWKYCESIGFGATLAQIHTTAEYFQITNMLKARGIPFAWWLAMRRDVGANGFSCSFPNDTSSWYESQSEKTKALTTANSWIRGHNCDDTDMKNGTEGFMALVPTNATATKIENKYTFLDMPEKNGNVLPLCQITNCEQTYNLVSNTCIVEIPIEILPGSEAKDCAEQCSKLVWCRSFNFLSTTTKCELFSWVASENGFAKPALSSTSGACIHYDTDITERQ